jgi:cytochrome P450
VAVVDNIFSDAQQWADMDEWRRRAAEMQKEGPIHRVESDHFGPFWAVIGHEAITDVERQHGLFRNAPEPVLASRKAIEAREYPLRTLVHMDAPDHPKYRKLGAAWFRPATIRHMGDRLELLSVRAVDRLIEARGSCDFATEIAHRYPLEAVLEILGMPPEDFDMMLRLTQEMFGGEDPDLRRRRSTPETFGQIVGEIMAYFSRLAADRRAHPTDDLASAIANGTIDGEPIPEMDTLSYYLIVATAGHDTTSYAMAGGLHALLCNPPQLELLRADPALLNNAVEEIFRWTTPARHFMRTAHEDTVVAGQRISKGDWIYLSYVAANLDATVFDDPQRFDITRTDADRQLSFGHGVHFCLGAQLARMEVRSLLRKILECVDAIELDGEAAFTQTTSVGGVKRLPIRYQIAGAATAPS